MELFPQPAPPRGDDARRRIAAMFRKSARFLCAENPLYVVSAWLIFWGLRISFTMVPSSCATAALVIGLTAYVVILATAGSCLINVSRLWDEVRTLLLLVVLMFPAISAGLDGALIVNPVAGILLSLGGLGFAAVVGELVLYFTGLRLAIRFRVPYYLILSLLFLYPIAPALLTDDPAGPAPYWVLFAFCPLAGVLFLTLLPAVRAGPRYTRENGSPWRWPCYPWILFAAMALGVFGRSYYLCRSFEGTDGASTVFAPYFWVPFLLALNILLLEVALRSRLRKLCTVAIVAPFAILALAATAPVAGEHTRELPNRFADIPHGTPLYWTLACILGFYGYAVLRRARYAPRALIVALLAAAVVGPETVDPATLCKLRWSPILSGGFLFSAVAAREGRSQDWFTATLFLIGAAVAAGHGTSAGVYYAPILGTLLLASVLILGAVFNDPFADMLRALGIPLALYLGMLILFSDTQPVRDVPQFVLTSYAINLAAVTVLYGYFTKTPLYHVAAVALVVGSFVTPCRQLLGLLDEPIPGLKQIIGGIAVFIAAIAVSLSKMKREEGLLGLQTPPPPTPPPSRAGVPTGDGSPSSTPPGGRRENPPGRSQPPTGKKHGPERPFSPKTRPKSEASRTSPDSNKEPRLHFGGTIRGAIQGMIWHLRWDRGE